VRRTGFADWPCSLARSVDLLGDWWTPLVLRDAYYGVRRFEDFQRSLGIGRNILTQRLSRLVDEGMLERRPYQDRPVRHEYVLTDKGRDFFPVVAAIVRWGDRWLAGDEGPPVTLHHVPCDHDMHAEVVCSQCREPLALRDVTARLEPAAQRPRPGPPA
jgi:DNA-binding HxlR family transcriptional regulator